MLFVCPPIPHPRSSKNHSVAWHSNWCKTIRTLTVVLHSQRKISNLRFKPFSSIASQRRIFLLRWEWEVMVLAAKSLMKTEKWENSLRKISFFVGIHFQFGFRNWMVVARSSDEAIGPDMHGKKNHETSSTVMHWTPGLRTPITAHHFAINWKSSRDVATQMFRLKRISGCGFSSNHCMDWLRQRVLIENHFNHLKCATVGRIETNQTKVPNGDTPNRWCFVIIGQFDVSSPQMWWNYATRQRTHTHTHVFLCVRAWENVFGTIGSMRSIYILTEIGKLINFNENHLFIELTNWPN